MDQQPSSRVRHDPPHAHKHTQASLSIGIAPPPDLGDLDAGGDGATTTNYNLLIDYQLNSNCHHGDKPPLR